MSPSKSDAAAEPASASRLLSHDGGDDNRPAGGAGQPAPAPAPDQGQGQGHGAKPKKRHRAGKKHRKRRASFNAPTAATPTVDDVGEIDRRATALSNIDEALEGSAARPSFYRLSRQRSGTSLASDCLLDHREQQSRHSRRESRLGPSMFSSTRPRTHDYDVTFGDPFQSNDSGLAQRPGSGKAPSFISTSDDDGESSVNARTPLLSRSITEREDYGPRSPFNKIFGAQRRGTESRHSRHRKPSTSTSSLHHSNAPGSRDKKQQAYDVNNPPSVPGSPRLEASGTPGMPELSASVQDIRGDVLIDIDEHADDEMPPREGFGNRRHTISVSAEEDVCFPQEDISLAGEEYGPRYQDGSTMTGPRKRRRKQWPDLSYLEAWAEEEKESRSEEIRRTKTVSEPVMVDGRLRPQKSEWHRTEEDAPFRFTYFNETFESTIHSQTLSDLLQAGQTFRDLFIPDPMIIDESSSEEEDDPSPPHQGSNIIPMERRLFSPALGESRNSTNTRQSSFIGNSALKSDSQSTRAVSGTLCPGISISLNGNGNGNGNGNWIDSGNGNGNGSAGNGTRANSAGEATPCTYPDVGDKGVRYGDRPTFWLDVLSPTEAEMKTISKAFSIHPLTSEDIMVQEAREKVELFRNYYFINYRSYEQDENSEEYMEPVDFYIVVFREGILTFHFSQTPHPNNVRRRIRQLKDYLILSSDWICFAIIDDITDAFAPKIHAIEEEVDEIDDSILEMHSRSSPVGNSDGSSTIARRSPTPSQSKYFRLDEKWREENGAAETQDSAASVDMLRQVGAARKKVMKFLRLLGNKADVIKGFAKRCNEQWEVAPRSEIGLYLGDIQDHILTMTSNLSHFETLLSRAHSNYLAQINIIMNERSEQTADVLGKLTVLGTIVLPMNIVTGLWGMNCLVPGQDGDDLHWFWGLTGSLLVFGFSCYFIAKKVYGIV